MAPVDIKSLTLPELTAQITAMGLPAYRAKQIFSWLQVRGAESFAEMTNLSKALREQLAEAFALRTCAVVRKQTSQDDTVKYLFRLIDGECIESVLMHYKYGYTLCVSSQVGCKMGCGFCASTLGGFVRNLTASEILSQIHAAQRDRDVRVSHVVLMGMGEPLDNFDNVCRFLDLVSDAQGLNISMRNISLSTCGLVPRIYDLMARHYALTLSVSIHAPNDAIRSSIMPVNRRYPMEQLLRACRDYARETGRRISFEYTMISGVNDSDACAEELAARLRGMLAHVNLIPANEFQESPYARSAAEQVERFARVLTRCGVNATIRRSLGGDIDASCGQLRLQDKKRRSNPLIIAKRTDIGRVRSVNQDACAAGDFPDGMVWTVVCDGMGGASSGDVASTTAVKIISGRIQSSYREGMQANSLRSLLLSAIEAANAVVYDMACANPTFSGMGTTVVTAILRDGVAYIAHAGDSRAYRITGGMMHQITRDHSMVQDMVDRGQITPSEAKDHPRKNIITRALGVDERLLIDFCEEPFLSGDILLICTDGLSNAVEDDEICRIALSADVGQAIDQLVDKANQNGGQDNITVVMIV